MYVDLAVSQPKYNLYQMCMFINDSFSRSVGAGRVCFPWRFQSYLCTLMSIINIIVTLVAEYTYFATNVEGVQI